MRCPYEARLHADFLGGTDIWLLSDGYSFAGVTICLVLFSVLEWIEVAHRLHHVIGSQVAWHLFE